MKAETTHRQVIQAVAVANPSEVETALREHYSRRIRALYALARERMGYGCVPDNPKGADWIAMQDAVRNGTVALHEQLTRANAIEAEFSALVSEASFTLAAFERTSASP